MSVQWSEVGLRLAVPLLEGSRWLYTLAGEAAARWRPRSARVRLDEAPFFNQSDVCPGMRCRMSSVVAIGGSRRRVE